MKDDVREILFAFALVLFELWNIHQAKRSGRIFFGRFYARERNGSNEFKITIILNIVFTVYLVVFIIYLLLKDIRSFAANVETTP